MGGMNLDQVRSELSSIIGELRRIEQGVRSDFSGIGQDRCANCINAIADYYEFTVLTQLNSMNQGLISQLLSSD